MRRILAVLCTVLIITTLANNKRMYARNIDNIDLVIATVETRPLSCDQLLYSAFGNINYGVSLSLTSLTAGYEMANAGSIDGAIASTPGIERDYPDLVKVPVPLDTVFLYALAHEGNINEIGGWGDLSGLTVGILSQRPYTKSQIPDDADILQKDSLGELVSGLQGGEYDVAIVPQRSAEPKSSWDGLVYSEPLDEFADYLYLNKKLEHLVPEIENELKSMLEGGIGDKNSTDISVPEISSKKTVLHITSASMETMREEMFESRLKEYFKDDMTIEWYMLEIGSRQFSMDPHRLSYFANILRQDLLSRNVAAILVSGDDALDFVNNYYNILFEDVPVLFYGVSEERGRAAHDNNPKFTGIIERPLIYETVSKALELIPDTKSVYVINDSMTEGMYYRELAEKQLARLEDSENSISISYNENSSIDLLIESISNLPADGIVFIGSFFCDKNGLFITQRETKRLLKRYCKVPVFSLHSTSLEYNAVGGLCVDYQQTALDISKMLERVLIGEDITAMPVIMDYDGYSRWVFDKTILDQYGISEKQLPKNAMLINREQSVWESDPRFALSFVILFILCIAIVIGTCTMVYKHSRDKEQILHEAKIREVKERLELVITTAPIAYGMLVDGILVDINESAKNDLGLVIGDNFYSSNIAQDLPGMTKRITEQGFIKKKKYWLRCRDGMLRRYLISASYIDYEGKKAVVAWGADIEPDEIQKDQLKTAQQNIQLVLDLVPVPVAMVDTITAKLVYANNHWYEMFEYDKETGISLSMLFPAFQSDGTDSAAMISNLLMIGDTEPLDVEYVSGKGSLITTRVTSRVIDYRGRVTSLEVITDLSDDKESEKIRQSLQTVLDMLPMPLRIIDLESNKLIYLNNAAAEMFGYDPGEDIYGTDMDDLMPPTQPDGSISSDMFAAFNRGQRPATEKFVCRKATGELFDVLITSCHIDYRGKKSSLGIMKDLTAEDEYQRMLLSTAEKEREANLLKSRFLVNMSHEIRTPMNIVIGLTEIELHKPQKKEAKEVFMKINSSAKNLMEIINDILDLSKIEADKIELFIDDFELEEVLNSAMLVATPRLEGKSVELILNAGVGLPRFVRGDRTRLWQTLKNYLDNAAKYTDSGRIVMTVFPDDDQSNEDEVTLLFIIEDTGIGMDDQQLKKLFMPYEQAYNEAQKKYSGTGLGMAISKQLCELMGGTLQVDSRRGVGTTIHMSIPFLRAENNETGWQVLKKAPLTGKRILAIDDDRLTLDIIGQILKSCDADYTSALGGTAALEIILKQRDEGKYFDLILIDYMMGGLSGLETASRIGMMYSKTPLLLMATTYQRMLLNRDVDTGCISDIIEKPFVPSQFIHKLSVALGLEDEYETVAEDGLTKFKDVRALIFEDYKLNQEVAINMFEQFGIETVVADNGKRGIEILSASDDNGFDMIFMDLQMPVMDGYEATRMIRANPRYDGIPIISMTADAMTEVVEKCMEIGMNDHIAKPIHHESLHRAFLKWLPESKHAAGKTQRSTSDEVLSRFNGSRELYDKAMADYASELPVNWPGFEYVIGNVDEMSRLVHKLKGAAGNLGLNDIYKAATDFEGSVKDQKPDIELYEKLVGAADRFKGLIIKNVPNDEKPAQNGTSEEFKILLSELRDTMHNYDPIASSDLISQMRGKQWPEAEAQLFERIMVPAQRYEFDVALDILWSANILHN